MSDEPMRYTMPPVEQGSVVIGTVVLAKVMKANGDIVFHEHFDKTLSVMEKYGMCRSAGDTISRWLSQP